MTTKVQRSSLSVVIAAVMFGADCSSTPDYAAPPTFSVSNDAVAAGLLGDVQQPKGVVVHTVRTGAEPQQGAALAATYRRATAKMDNGHVETYLRYRIIGPFIRR
jgi:hypothetical protein